MINFAKKSMHIETLNAEAGFLAIPEAELATYSAAKVIIQQAPYEKTSSYISGSDKGPAAIIEASHYVEFFDEELRQETYKKIGGIATMPAMSFTGLENKAATDYIAKETKLHVDNNKFVVSLGAEHTVSLGFVQGHLEQYPNLSVLQIDAHSDLRESYQGNPYSHASVMARIHDLNINLVQVGIRAQCKEEYELMLNSRNIHTWYAHQLWNSDDWMDACIEKLGPEVYLTIDADGFDPSVAPAVGTAEPGGLSWIQGCKLLKKLAEKRKVIGFDIVEIAPKENEILTQFNMAKLCYKILGYLNINHQL